MAKGKQKEVLKTVINPKAYHRCTGLILEDGAVVEVDAHAVYPFGLAIYKDAGGFWCVSHIPSGLSLIAAANISGQLRMSEARSKRILKEFCEEWGRYVEVNSQPDPTEFTFGKQLDPDDPLRDRVFPILKHCISHVKDLRL